MRGMKYKTPIIVAVAILVFCPFGVCAAWAANDSPDAKAAESSAAGADAAAAEKPRSISEDALSFWERLQLGQLMKDNTPVQLEDLISPASLALLALGLGLGLASLNMSVPLQRFSMKMLLLLYSIAFFWYAYNLVSVIDVLLQKLTSRTESQLDDQLVPLIRKSLRVFLVVIAVMFIFDTVLGQDITAWLAGLGIAGLAVSLAAQDSLKNLFGSVTVLLDRPFQVGERIVFSGYDGTIEEIGFRSTKIRTALGHLVTIPNANIVNAPVENIGRRPFIRRTIDVTITYDVSREKIEQAVEILEDLLEEEGLAEPIHPRIGENEYPPRVFFSDYNAESLNIKVLYWYSPPAYWDYMEHAQRLNLRIFEEFEKAGIEFAFPTQTLYLAGDPKRELALKMLGKDM